MHVIPSLGGVGVGNGYNQYTLTNLYSRGINPTAIRLRPFRAFIYSLLPSPYSLKSHWLQLQPCGFGDAEHQVHVLNRLSRCPLKQVVDDAHH